MSDDFQPDFVHVSAADTPLERSKPRPRTNKALPTDRLKFDMQVMALKALAMESQNGSHPVGAAELARRIGVAESTAGLNNAFFTEAGLATKAGKGKFKPTEAALEFERDAGFEDQEIAAKKHLSGPLSQAWFFSEIKSQIALKDSSESRIMAVLANAAGASGAHRTKLLALLDWLALAGLILREDGKVSLVGDAADVVPGERPKTPETEDQTAGKESTKVVEDRGPVVLDFKFVCSYTAKDLAELNPEQIRALYEAVGGVQAVQAILLKGSEQN